MLVHTVQQQCRMNFSGYIWHVTVFTWTLTTACCLVVRLWLYLFSGWLMVMCTYLYYVSLSLSRCRLQFSVLSCVFWRPKRQPIGSIQQPGSINVFLCSFAIKSPIVLTCRPARPPPLPLKAGGCPGPKRLGAGPDVVVGPNRHTAGPSVWSSYTRCLSLRLPLFSNVYKQPSKKRRTSTVYIVQCRPFKFALPEYESLILANGNGNDNIGYWNWRKPIWKSTCHCFAKDMFHVSIEETNNSMSTDWPPSVAELLVFCTASILCVTVR